MFGFNYTSEFVKTAFLFSFKAIERFACAINDKT